MSAPTKPEHKIICEALAAHEVFRRLGFTPDEIFIHPHSDELFVVVKRAALMFSLTLGKHDINDVNSVIEKWTAAADWWNTGPEPERRELFDRSEVRKNVVMIIAAMQAKGFAVHRSDA